MSSKTKLEILSLAEVVSRVSGPPSEIPIFIGLPLLPYLGSSPPGKFVIFMLISLLIGWFVPVVYFIYALRRGWIGNLDATDRRDRLVPYTVFFLCWTLLIIISRRFLPPELIRAYYPFYFTILIIWLVTFVYKISVHAAVNTLLYWQANVLLGWRLWWLFPLVLLVCWSRWVKKNHSPWQLILGAGVAVGVSLLAGG